MENDGIWYYFYNDELDNLTNRQMIEEMAKISGIADPGRYHVRDVNGERVAIALYGPFESDPHFSSLEKGTSNLDSSFGGRECDDEYHDWEND